MDPLQFQTSWQGSWRGHRSVVPEGSADVRREFPAAGRRREAFRETPRAGTTRRGAAMRVPLRRRVMNELREPVAMHRLVRHAPLAILQSCVRRAIDVHPAAPWIPFDAAARLREFLRSRPNATVLEYGSGMSTAWFARHAGHVVSVESDPAWARKVRSRLAADGSQDRVRLVEATDATEYVTVAGTMPAAVDLLVIDGIDRLACGLHAMRSCKPDGVIYVDDSDMRGTQPEMQRLVESVDRYARSRGGRCEFITDFSPSQAFPKQGMLAWLSPTREPHASPDQEGTRSSRQSYAFESDE